MVNTIITDKPLEAGQESDTEITNCNSFSFDQSEASNGRPTVGSTIRNVVRQSLSELGDPGATSKTKKTQTNGAKSEGTKSIPDEETDKKSMPDRVAEMLAEVTTPHMVSTTNLETHYRPHSEGMGKVMFSVCVSVHTEEVSYIHPRILPLVPCPFRGGVPHQSQAGGTTAMTGWVPPI